MQAGQAAHTCDSWERESGFGPLWCSRLLRSTTGQGEVWRRHAARADPARPAPPERGGEIFSGKGRPWCGPLDSGPEGRWFTPQHEDRSLHHRGRISVERPGAHGFDPGSDSYRGHCAACPPSTRGSTPPALSRNKPMGASGRGRWQQRPRLRTRQRSKALRPAAASGVGAAVRNRTRRPAAATCNGEKVSPVGDDGTAADEGNASKGRA
jgi:hypothetical protein